MWKPTKKQHLVNKKYADANGGGSGSEEIFVVHFIVDDPESDNPTFTADKTFAEIWEAAVAGKIVIATAPFVAPTVFSLMSLDEGDILFIYSGFTINNDSDLDVKSIYFISQVFDIDNQEHVTLHFNEELFPITNQ